MLSPLLLIAATLTLAAALTCAAAPIFNQPCDPEDTIQSRLAAFRSHTGSEPTDEYTPADADNDSLSHHDPPFWLSPNPDAPPPDQPPGLTPSDLTLIAPTPQHLILNLRQYPAWHITINDHELPATLLTQAPRADGLITIPIPSGPIHVHLTYRATSVEHAAEIISTLALLILTFLYAKRFRPSASAMPPRLSSKLDD